MWSNNKSRFAFTQIAETQQKLMKFLMLFLLFCCLVLAQTTPILKKEDLTQKESIPDLLDKMRTKYSNILLNAEALPFLKECTLSRGTNANDPTVFPADKLCIVYYDIIWNMYVRNITGCETKESLQETLQVFDQEKIFGPFCSLFPVELRIALERHPFSDASGTNISSVMGSTTSCILRCLKQKPSSLQLEEICKMISEGSRLLKKTKDEPATSDRTVDNKQRNNSTSSNANVTNSPIQIPKRTDDANSGNNANLANGVKAPSIVNPPVQEKSPSPVQKKIEPPTTVAASVGTAPKERPIPDEQNNVPMAPDDGSYNDEKTEFEDDRKNMDDNTEIEAGDDMPKNQQDVLISNHIQSPFSADSDGNKFRVDKDSSFFSYFMFLMLVIVIFYIGYHNKSKVLALLIEGRRNRGYSSRNGSRRKQHSAEYRKLDSNLEEAIRSGGNQVSSSSIIY